jgi:diguanylate cyclase (GGDEF)-like protein
MPVPSSGSTEGPLWLPGPPDPPLSRLAELAAAYDAADILVFRRVARGRYAHLGGYGRGEGWAGIVEVDLDTDPWLAETVLSSRVQRIQTRNAVRIMGPFYARTAVVVPVDGDRIVVWGSVANAPLFAATSDADLVQLSREADEAVGAVSPAKMLADELELLHVVQSLTANLNDGFPETIRHIAATVADALSCELAVVLTGSGQFAVANRGWAPTTDEAELHDALRREFVNIVDTICVQDAWDVPLREPLAPEMGISAYLTVPLPAAIGGFLFAAHTTIRPRGFTQLCQRIGEQIGDAAGTLLQVSSLRAALQDQLAVSTDQARRDALTGLGNRLAWQEALQNAQLDIDTGQTVTLVSVDVDLLKQTNDEHGHAAGDRILCSVAEQLRLISRDGDLICRLGGDEFGILIHHHDVSGAARITDRLRSSMASACTADGLRVHVSIGLATAEPGASLLHTMHDADVAMYADKRARRAQLT